jgi:hypothetical protein
LSCRLLQKFPGILCSPVTVKYIVTKRIHFLTKRGGI